MAHQALYRKWRPMIFEDIVGQEHITRTLKNQIVTDKIAHAYLFCGTRGTGKTTCAKVFSRAVNCLNPKQGSPCNECPVCRGILDGSIMDVKEIDAASNNGVDSIREIREDAQYVSAGTKYTVYIIDEVHMLSTGAFNALLKTLEEPPQNVIFILATTEAQKVPQTILSRCQRFDFKRIKPEDIILRMREIALGDKLDISDDGYKLLARLADGSMRDALSILERVVSTTSETVTAELITDILGISDEEQILTVINACVGGDVDKILSVIDRVIQDGKDLNVFVDAVIAKLRDLLIIKVSANAGSILNYSADALVKLNALCGRMTFNKISNMIKILSDARSDAKWVKSPRVIYELALIKAARPDVDTTPKGIEDRLAALEEQKTAPQNDGFNAAVIKKIDELEKKIEMGVPVVEKREETPPEKKKDPPARLYNPIPESELNAEYPTIQLAKNWKSTLKAIKTIMQRKQGGQGVFESAFKMYTPYPDRDGIMLLYERDGKFSHDLAKQHQKEIEAAFREAAQTPCTIKIAYEDELEGNIIDYWRLPSASDNANTADNAPSTEDPLDRLAAMSIVENLDESEFITYDAENAGYTQSSIDDDREEFLDGNELKSEED